MDQYLSTPTGHYQIQWTMHLQIKARAHECCKSLPPSESHKQRCNGSTGNQQTGTANIPPIKCTKQRGCKCKSHQNYLWTFPTSSLISSSWYPSINHTIYPQYPCNLAHYMLLVWFGGRHNWFAVTSYVPHCNAPFDRGHVTSYSENGVKHQAS